MTQSTTSAQINAVDLLTQYANSRPGLELRDYFDPSDFRGRAEGLRAYRRDSAEITRDLHDYRELLTVALRLYTLDELNTALIEYLSNTGDRLTLEGDRLRFVACQYSPTEYRPAACRVLRLMIWRKLSDQCETAGEIRTAARRLLSRRVCRNYFN